MFLKARVISRAAERPRATLYKAAAPMHLELTGGETKGPWPGKQHVFPRKELVLLEGDDNPAQEKVRSSIFSTFSPATLVLKKETHKIPCKSTKPAPRSDASSGLSPRAPAPLPCG